MSGKISIGVPVLFLPAKTEDRDDGDAGEKKDEKEAAQHIQSSSCTMVMCCPPVFREAVARFHFGETRIARFDGEEKSVVGHAAETIPVENRDDASAAARS